MDEVMALMKRPLFTVNGMSLTIGALVAIVVVAFIYTTYIRK